MDGDNKVSNKKRATIQITTTVEFEDNGEDDLKDQAMEALDDTFSFSCHQDFDFVSVVGEVEDAE